MLPSVSAPENSDLAFASPSYRIRKRACCGMFSVLLCLAGPEMTGCRSVSRMLPLAASESAIPAATPSLSLAATDQSYCTDATPAQLLAVGRWKKGDTALILGPYESVSTDDNGGIGYGIVRQLRCTRHIVEIELPLKKASSTDGPARQGIQSEVVMVELFLLVPSDRLWLWSLADSLRLRANEPFVYGTSVELSEDESVSLRFDAKGSSPRLMLVYRVEL